MRINTTIEAELAEWVLTWQRRGLVKSVSDGVRQALIALNEKIQLMDERAQRLRMISEESHSDSGV